MKLTLGRLNSISFSFLVIITGLIIGYIHHYWFYPLQFHGDSSAMQILAQAMLDERSFLSKDITYGNQLILFRSNPFIAMALACGASGYDAFLLGSTVSAAFWFTVLYFPLFKFTGDKICALILSTAFLIPTGIWDHDLILGQQSALANVVLSINIVVFSWLYFSTNKIYPAILAAFFTFLMVVEAPIRALLVCFPLSFLVFVFFDRHTGFKFLAIMFSALVIGFLVNNVLTSTYPPVINHFQIISFRDTNQILNNLVKVILETIAHMSSINLLASQKISFIGIILLAGSLGFSILLIGFFRFIRQMST